MGPPCCAVITCCSVIAVETGVGKHCLVQVGKASMASSSRGLDQRDSGEVNVCPQAVFEAVADRWTGRHRSGLAYSQRDHPQAD